MAELEFDDDEEAEEEEDEEVRSGSLCGTDSCAIVPRSFADQSGRLAQDAEGKPEYKIRNSYGEGEKELKVSREHARQGTACLRLQDGCCVSPCSCCIASTTKLRRPPGEPRPAGAALSRPSHAHQPAPDPSLPQPLRYDEGQRNRGRHVDETRPCRPRRCATVSSGSQLYRIASQLLAAQATASSWRWPG